MPVYSLRASSIWELSDCALRWYAKHVLKKTSPMYPPAIIGTATHRSTAYHDLEKMKGHAVSANDSIEPGIEYLRNPDTEIIWDNISPQDAELTVAKVHHKYVEEISNTRSYAAVELQLQPLMLDVGDGITFELTGTLDRVRHVQSNGSARQGISDVKTGKLACSAAGVVKTASHGIQLAAYELIYEFNSRIECSLDPEIIGLSTGKTPNVGTVTLPNARNALRGTPDQPGYFNMIAQYFKTGLFPPNPASMLCGKKYCPHFDACIYHG